MDVINAIKKCLRYLLRDALSKGGILLLLTIFRHSADALQVLAHC
ncbi:hypothetical protein SpAn4DRAFT_3665 [Sporomusa ovata]|uniref:Uncharacterized protein n=1 Tax=Sporomusa ovata TaxID=2378 RepID=A0A0U1KXF4_9FIRM|nr:hypothetical protein SpAn4DRAFT_3665 [Sporomusa ovata]